MIDCVEQSYYQISDKNLLLQEYKEVFNIELCSTCTNSPITAFNALRTYQLNMANKKTTKQEPVKSAMRTINPLYKDGTLVVAGVGQIHLSSITDEEIAKYILPNRKLHELLNEA